MMRELSGEGGALSVESAPGLGRSRLLDASILDAKARAAGLPVAMLPTDFESVVLGDASGPLRRSAASKVTAALHMHDQTARAQRALELLCETANAAAGHMYLLRDEQLERVATIGAPASTALETFAREYWDTQLRKRQDDALTTRSSDDASEVSAD